MKTGDSLGSKKGRALASIWHLDEKHGGENRMLPLESQEHLPTQKGREEKQVQMNKSRCFQRALIYSSRETQAEKTSATAIIKQSSTTPKQREAETPWQHHPTNTKASAPGTSDVLGTIKPRWQETTETRDPEPT